MRLSFLPPNVVDRRVSVHGGMWYLYVFHVCATMVGREKGKRNVVPLTLVTSSRLDTPRRERRRRRRRKVYSGANTVNEEDLERDRATQV